MPPPWSVGPNDLLVASSLRTHHGPADPHNQKTSANHHGTKAADSQFTWESLFSPAGTYSRIPQGKAVIETAEMGK